MVKFQPMNTQLVYGFLDESPSLSDKNFFFCVAILSAANFSRRTLQNILKKTRRRVLKKKLKSLAEIKFYNSDERTRRFILSEIAKQDIKICALVLDKEGRKIKDTPVNYGTVVGAAIAEFLLLHPSLNLTIDKRYTFPKEYAKFMQVSEKIIYKLIPKDRNVFIKFEPPMDSMKEKLLQLTDFVVGALNFKYNQNDSHYVDLVRNKIVREKITKWSQLKKEAIDP